MTFPATAQRGRWRLPALVLLVVANLGLVGANLERRDLVSFGTPADDTSASDGSEVTTSLPESTESTPSSSAPTDTSVEAGDGTTSSTVDDWPGGRGPVPEGPPMRRRVDLDPAGRAVITGSAPDWATASRVAEYVAGNLGVELSAVENQLTWHPDAAVEIQAGQVLIEQAANFGLGSSEIDEESLPTLDFVGGLLRSRPTLFVVIIGHTDDVGDADLNAQLASTRAQAVSDYLVSVGVVPDQLVLAAAGEDAPVASNDTPEGRRFNRRIELQLKNFLIPPGSLG